MFSELKQVHQPALNIMNKISLKKKNKNKNAAALYSTLINRKI